MERKKNRNTGIINHNTENYTLYLVVERRADKAKKKRNVNQNDGGRERHGAQKEEKRGEKVEAKRKALSNPFRGVGETGEVSAERG